MTTTTIDRTETEDPRVTEMRNSPSIAQLKKMTATTLGDLVRVGASMTKPAVGWGNEESACALSAAGLAHEALSKL